jgi:DNA repair protein RadD
MSGLFSTPSALRPLRPHQERALEALRASLTTGKRRPMLQAPTGFGKTLTAAHIIQRALDKGNRVIFTVPALSLVDQTVAAFAAEGIHSIGVMQGYHPGTDGEQPLQVCSVQTLARRQKPEAAIVLIDEAHLAFKSVHEWMADPAWTAVPFIGMSATPWTRGLGKHYDDLIVAPMTGDLIRDGYLSPFVVFAPSAPDLADVRTVAGDFHEGELADACDKPALVGDVIETWGKRGENRATLCYGVNRAHAEHIQQRFLEAGVAADYIDSFTGRGERERVFDRFRAGETRIICNVGTLTVGVDLDVRCIIDAKPTKSEILFVQTIGRGLRTAEGKDKLIVLDHAGNHLRLGRVIDIHHDRLDLGQPCRCAAEANRNTPLPRLCEDCSAVLPQSARVCPECGKVREARTEIEHRDGVLVELGASLPHGAEAPPAEQAAFHGELQWVAIVKGYAPGWASHKFRERFGYWPNHPSIRTAAPREPSLKTKNWLRSRQIAWAKGKRAYG